MLLYKCTLPFPVSVNSAYNGGSGQKRFPSKRYKEWLLKCPALELVGIKDCVYIVYTFAWPDNRRRDGGNFTKVVLDFLVNQGVLDDDDWKIVGSETWKHIGVDKKNPRVIVEIYRMEIEK